MFKGLNLKILCSMALAVSVFPAIVIYYGTRPPVPIEHQHIKYVEQQYGESRAIDINLSQFHDYDDASFYTSVVTSTGEVLTRTPRQYVDRRTKYTMITYSRLPVGVYNVNVHVGYKLNFVAYRNSMMPLAVLNVTKGESHDSSECKPDSGAESKSR